MRVRRAAVDDADAIERIRTDTWRDAYRGLLPDSLLHGLGYDGTRRRAVMAAMPPEQFVLVADDDGAVVGFCIGGPSRSPNDPFRGEVYAIYVLPEHHRRGAGRALLEAAVMELLGRVRALLLRRARSAHAKQPAKAKPSRTSGWAEFMCAMKSASSTAYA